MKSERRTLLIVNPNTNVQVTQWLAEEARLLAGDAWEVLAVNADSRIEAIQRPDDIRIAAEAVAPVVARAPWASAALIAAFGDPGLSEARQLNLMPIVGLGECGVAAAARAGREFSIVTLGEAMREPILAKVAALGFADRLIDLHILPFTIPDLVADRMRRLEAIAAAVRACVTDVVLLAGAPFAGLGRGLSQQTGKTTIDGVAASLKALGVGDISA